MCIRQGIFMSAPFSSSLLMKLLVYYCFFRLYKDAVKLQRLMQQTVHELLDIAQDSSSDDDESLLSMKTSASRGRGLF